MPTKKYRPLKFGEVIEKGDEFFDRPYRGKRSWRLCDSSIGDVYQDGFTPRRRPIKSRKNIG